MTFNVHAELLPLIHKIDRQAWVEPNMERAIKMFPNQGVHLAVAALARSHERAIDYIEQAPVLVMLAHNASVTLSRWANPQRRQERDHVAVSFAERVAPGPRLKDLLASYQAPLPMRKFKPAAIIPSRVGVIGELRAIPASTLSQIIPETSSGQLKWTGALWRWKEKWRFDTLGLHATHFEWAASAISAEIRNGERGIQADVVADYVINHRDFSGKMTWRGAVAAAERWHEELSRQVKEADFLKQYGIGMDTVMSYGRLPLISEHDGFTFQALQTGRDLFLEGEAMRHCVLSYTPAVAQGQSFIYSIRKGDKRIATLELGRDKIIKQLKGPCNAQPRADVRDAAASFRAFALKQAIESHVAEQWYQGRR